ncbi:hypothetical protein BURK1_02157 [Burkholderiales bacterium]|nr:hypothetical protein BURK1_02157 [Burkholderiales bacterium]
MPDAELNSLLTIALMAAFADGAKHEPERLRMRELASKLGGGRVDLAELDRKVLLERAPLAEVVRPLSTPALRQYAFELAVTVVDSDGVHGEAEGAFLRDLAAALGLPADAAARVVADADAIAAAPTADAPGAPARLVVGRVMPDVAELDRRIVNASITNAALELLPDSLASMAILPLQVRLVYKVGQAYGYPLDQGHIKEFIATLGVGLTGQYLEEFGRKLLGGLLGAVLGGLGRAIGRQAASSGMSFATTWALGQVAKQYYGGGRTLDAAKLKAAFAPLLEQGQGMMQRYGGEIAERAKTIDVRNLPALIRQV